jgi:hypothetical protein
MVARDEVRESLLGAHTQLFDESRFVRVERQCAGNIAHGEVRLQTQCLPHYRNDRTLGIFSNALTIGV